MSTTGREALRRRAAGVSGAPGRQAVTVGRGAVAVVEGGAR